MKDSTIANAFEEMASWFVTRANGFPEYSRLRELWLDAAADYVSKANRLL